MLVIRLSRKGRRNLPMYRITVAENSMPTDGKFVEIVGNYNPTDLNQPLVIQKDRVEYWISKGAKPTNTVAKLLNKQGFSLPVEEYHKAPKKQAKPAEAAAVAPVTPAAEKPAEEVAPAEEQPVAEVAAEAVPVEKKEKEEEILNQVQDDEGKAPVEETKEEMPETKDSGIAPEASQNNGGEILK